MNKNNKEQTHKNSDDQDKELQDSTSINNKEESSLERKIGKYIESRKSVSREELAKKFPDYF